MIILIKVLLSILFGALIGFEREYRSKAAGFRTITLISLGCTVFTILSGVSPDSRISANIVTGIGFIGAGAIFKDGFSVSGLTTAASIWVAAAVGMAVGMGEYLLSTICCTAAIVILAGFEFLQIFIERFHQVRTYKVVFEPALYDKSSEVIIERVAELKLRLHTKKATRINGGILLQLSLAGDQLDLDQFSDYMLTAPGIKTFDE